MKKKIKHLLAQLVIAVPFMGAGSGLLTACNDYLDVVPKGDIQTESSLFEQRNDVYEWLKTCYILLTDHATGFLVNPAYLGADELVAGQYGRETYLSKADHNYFGGLFIGDGIQMAGNPYGNIWANDQFYAGIRYCNIFLENIDGCYNMSVSEKHLWTAEIKALKAHYYFELMRRYGPIVLVPKNIAANAKTEEMQQARQPIDSCVAAIVNLCDEAMEYLPLMKEKSQERWCYYNKEAAATLKAYALLWAASPLFNGNDTYRDFTNKDGQRLFPSYDREKWLRAAEAADEALNICKMAGRSLYNGTTVLSSQLLNTIRDCELSSLQLAFKNDEVLLTFMPQGQGNASRYKVPQIPTATDANLHDDYAMGCLTPSLKMVEMYYTDHGLPITEDKQWLSSPYQMSKEADTKYRNVVPLNTDVLTLHRRREPRFYANIVADGTYWTRIQEINGANLETPILVNTYQGQKFGTSISSINSTVPQSLTGYWLKKGIVPSVPLRNYTLSEGSSIYTMTVFRMAELYLMSAEAWNEYLDAPNDHVYDAIDVVRKRAGIPNVRDAWQTYAKNPQLVETQAGMREIIQREWNIEMAFEGRRFWNLRRWLKAAQELNTPLYGWNVLASTPQGFYNNYDGPVVVWSKRKFTAPRDYLFPIRSEEILVSGVKQNLGW